MNKTSTNQKSEIKVTDSVIDKSDPISTKSIEEFENIDVTEFNINLAQKAIKMSPIDIMKMYYPHKAGQEGKEEITISKKILDNGNIEVTLIHDYQLDDAVKGEKYIMELNKQVDNWTVLVLKKNWKCYPTRGHTDWSIKLCN